MKIQAKENVIKYIESITLSILKEEYGKCKYCKNYRPYNVLSLCKIKCCLEPQCCYYDININKFIKKFYNRIYMMSFLQRNDEYTQEELRINKKTRVKIIHLSVKKYDTLMNVKKYNLMEEIK